MLKKIKENPEVFIRIIIVLILLSLIIIFSEGNWIVNLKSLVAGLGIGLLKITAVLCIGLLVLKIFQFIKYKYWSISSTNIKLLLVVITLCLLAIFCINKFIHSVVSSSGKSRPTLVSPLKEQAPKPSLEPWPCNNCAETKAVNSLVRDGSKIQNTEYHTVRTRTGTSEPPCTNCEKTLSGSKQN